MTTVIDTGRSNGLLAWLLGTDHKRLGVRTALTSGIFFVVSGTLALLIRAELAAPGLQFVSRDGYNQLFTLHGSGMIFLVLTPLALAFGVYLVPLQIGAAELAWPRAASLGYWLIASGGLTMFAGFATDHGAGKAGWTAYYPLSSAARTPGTGMDLWIVGVILAVAGSTVLAASILATVFVRRAPAMTAGRLPVFTWTMLVTCLMTLFSFPFLLAAMGLLLADRLLGGGVFDSAGGPIAYQHLFWFYGHPVVYIMFFPFVGAVAEVVAVFSRRRFFGYHALVLSLLGFTGLSMGVWAHHMFTTGQVTNQFFALTSTLLIVPAGVEYFDLLATMWGRRIVLKTPMLFALGFILQFLIGGLSGVFVGSPPLDYHVHDSYFVVGHFHYTLFAGSLFGLFAGVYYWFPKVTGALLREGLGRLHFVLLVLGTNLTFFPMLLLGYDGMPRRVADYGADSGFQGLNVVATIGAGAIAAAVAVFLANVVLSLGRRVAAGDDPWQGQTLEWWTSSPPPRFNFDSLPPIRSYTPLLDRRAEEAP